MSEKLAGFTRPTDDEREAGLTFLRTRLDASNTRFMFVEVARPTHDVSVLRVFAIMGNAFSGVPDLQEISGAFGDALGLLTARARREIATDKAVWALMRDFRELTGKHIEDFTVFQETH